MKLLVFLALVINIGCTISARNHVVTTEGGVAITRSEQRKYGDTFQWQSQGPLDFIEQLRKEGKRNWFPTYTVVGLHRGWVKEEDLPSLIELLDSQEPCANVMRAISSFIDSKPSTVGNEAAYIIEGFRYGEYPPSLNSTQPSLPNKEEIRKWYESYKKGA